MPVPPGFEFGLIAFTQRWVVGELDKDGQFQQVGEPYAEEPKDARWVKNPDTGKKRHVTASGLLVREEIGVVMQPEATGQICHYVTKKTAVKVGRAFSKRAQRLQVDGLDGVRGVVLGRFRATSFLQTDPDTGRNWNLPVFSCIGVLGQERGPSMERVLEMARLREAYLKGASLSEPQALEPPAPPAASKGPSSLDADQPPPPDDDDGCPESPEDIEFN
jgi:hypothetical protein